MRQKIQDAVSYIRQYTDLKPKVGLILGSGLGVLAEKIENPVIIPYQDIPHFPVSTVAGHAGQLVIGLLAGKPVAAMQGRFHFYEGYSLAEVTFPVRVIKELGADILFLTNAAGGVNRSFRAGDLMLIRDHINLMMRNPLRGKNDPELGPRFPDMSAAYSPALREMARKVAGEEGIDLKTGVYCGLTGPTYETPAEVRMLSFLGADAVGMSTVPEAIVAAHAGMQVIGISCITNMAAGILPQKLSHDEVIETTERVKETFKRLVKGILQNI